MRRGIAGVLFMLLMLLVFQRMDDTYVVPQRLKRVVEIMGVETEVSDDWYRARIRLRHRGFSANEVELTLAWLDAEGDEIGRNESRVRMSPGDTVNVRLSTKAIEGVRAVSHRLDYTVKRVSP